MKVQKMISEMKILALFTLSVLLFSPALYAAEYISMKAQGYQPIISVNEANRRDSVKLEKSDMTPISHQGTGRRTDLEKPAAPRVAVQAGQPSAES
jgi:hypothetical protein